MFLPQLINIKKNTGYTVTYIVTPFLQVYLRIYYKCQALMKFVKINIFS